MVVKDARHGSPLREDDVKETAGLRLRLLARHRFPLREDDVKETAVFGHASLLGIDSRSARTT
jgi:hypothetical protein